jgi:MoaA/NifB/PqqE/SkfB family radical SAM enzyme
MKKSLARCFLGSKLLSKPFYAHFYVTRRCNLACPMCSVYRQADKNAELNVPEINRLAENIRDIGLGMIVLTGGEPFIREDLGDIVEAFSSRGIIVRVQTNGILVTAEKLKHCYDKGLDFVTVSLDSADELKFDKLCGHAGLWQKAVNTIKLSVEMKPGNFTIVNTVVSRQNIEELPQIVKLVDSLGANSSLVPVHLADNNLIRNANSGMAFKPEDRSIIEKSYKEIMRLKKSGLRVGSSLKYLKDSMNYLLINDYKWKCDAGILYFVVFDNGDISPCDEYKGLHSNRGADICNIFNSAAFRDYSSNSRKSCAGCIWGCWRETSSLIHDNHIIGERIGFYIKNKMSKIGSHK